MLWISNLFYILYPCSVLFSSSVRQKAYNSNTNFIIHSVELLLNFGISFSMKQKCIITVASHHFHPVPPSNRQDLSATLNEIRKGRKLGRKVGRLTDWMAKEFVRKTNRKRSVLIMQRRNFKLIFTFCLITQDFLTAEKICYFLPVLADLRHLWEQKSLTVDGWELFFLCSLRAFRVLNWNVSFVTWLRWNATIWGKWRRLGYFPDQAKQFSLCEQLHYVLVKWIKAQWKHSVNSIVMNRHLWLFYGKEICHGDIGQQVTMLELSQKSIQVFLLSPGRSDTRPSLLIPQRTHSFSQPLKIIGLTYIRR